ncbi:DUF6907 domain-containing protein [Microbacterium testaceum]|uniref:DUF6907 domain-containing protein n=1 Tax=Microbacterium testaceum TaxID=2033 RepID=UPI0035930138
MLAGARLREDGGVACPSWCVADHTSQLEFDGNRWHYSQRAPTLAGRVAVMEEQLTAKLPAASCELDLWLEQPWDAVRPRLMISFGSRRSEVVELTMGSAERLVEVAAVLLNAARESLQSGNATHKSVDG